MSHSKQTLATRRRTGIGPLEPGLSTKWDMTPILGASDPRYRVRVEVDAEGRWLRVTRYRKLVGLDFTGRPYKLR